LKPLRYFFKGFSFFDLFSPRFALPFFRLENTTIPVTPEKGLRETVFFVPIRKKRISGGGTGLHWDEFDEEISVRGPLLAVGDRTRP
jgi:hypothetical protein